MPSDMDWEKSSSDMPAKNEKKVELEERETWSHKIQFLLGCMGFSVGLGNVWRFPYLCYRDGGGAFLIPYFLCVIIGAIPMFTLEIALGQYTSQGAITCWNLVPLFKGVGYGTQLIMFMHNTYYNVIMGWSFYYLFASFTTNLPWASCDNIWNSPWCREDAHAYVNVNASIKEYFANMSVEYISEKELLTGQGAVYMEQLEEVIGRNASLVDIMMLNGSINAIDPVTEYWENKVLGLSSGIDKLGPVKWDLALCLLLAWVVVYFCIWKGIKWTGKIMYVTTTSPYVFMLILLIRGATLPGAVDGIKYYLYPDISKLGNLRVWYGAATQVYFSYSMCLGTLTALGSYNKFHHNFLKDCWLFAAINSGTSILAGFIIFSILGFMSHQQHVSIDQVAESGPGLAFIAYPKAVAQLPGAPVWSVLFFIMLVLLGMDSQFGAVEGFVVAIMDHFPQYLRRKWGREIFVAAVCFVSYLVGLSMCTHGGMYIFLLFDYYSQARIILIIAFFEVIGISWVYGVDRFYDNIEVMLGWRMTPFLKWCWLVITPVFNLVVAGLCFYEYADVRYNRTYLYPQWAIRIGWAMAFISPAIIPAVMIYKIARTKGTLAQRIKFLCQSSIPMRKEELELKKTNDGVGMEFLANNVYDPTIL